MPSINILDNGVMKAIDFNPWGGIDGFLDATGTGAVNNRAELRGIVPWLQKGVNMTGNAVSQLPYEIEDSADNEIDSDLAWGAVQNPRRYIKLVADSLCGGCGYLGIKTTSRAIVSFQYIMPQTMTPNFDNNGSLINFTRQYPNGRSAIMSLEELVYFWLPDDTVETGPAYIHPLRNATLPAQLIAGMDSTLKQYSDRGFIPPTILAVSGMPNATEREKTEKWWNAFLRGWTRQAAKIVNSEVVKPQVIGAGMDELRGTYTEISRQQIENIAASFDIPMSLFMSNAANYATANSDRKTWYETGTFVSIFQTIEDSFNDQLFKRFGWHFEFELGKLPAFQDEESEKSGAISALSSTLANNPEEFMIVCDILGIELSQEQKNQIAALEDNSTPDITAQPQAISMVDESAVDATVEDQADAIAEEIAAWRNFAAKNHKREFEARHIPKMLYDRVKMELAHGDAVNEVFARALADVPTIKLAQAIDRMVTG